MLIAALTEILRLSTKPLMGIVNVSSAFFAQMGLIPLLSLPKTMANGLDISNICRGLADKLGSAR